jgi:YjbE family integral membrane protein
MEFLSGEYVIALLSILLFNILLSVDNAIVIAMASRGLPEKQKRLAIWWGSFGAIFLRIVLTVLVQYLLRVPLLQAIGGALLLWISIKLLIEDDHHNDIRGSSTLMAAVWTIIVADFIMSLDNVLAIAAAAKGDVSLVVIGLAISIPLIVWGSSLVSGLLHRFPVLIYLGAAILGYIAGEMLVQDRLIIEYVIRQKEFFHQIIPWSASILIIAIGYICRKRRKTA